MGVKEKTSQRKKPGGTNKHGKQSRSRDEMERYVPFSRHHGDDPDLDLEDDDHGSGFVSAADLYLLASYSFEGQYD